MYCLFSQMRRAESESLAANSAEDFERDSSRRQRLGRTTRRRSSMSVPDVRSCRRSTPGRLEDWNGVCGCSGGNVKDGSRGPISSHRAKRAPSPLGGVSVRREQVSDCRNRHWNPKSSSFCLVDLKQTLQGPLDSSSGWARTLAPPTGCSTQPRVKDLAVGSAGRGKFAVVLPAGICLWSEGRNRPSLVWILTPSGREAAPGKKTSSRNPLRFDFSLRRGRVGTYLAVTTSVWSAWGAPCSASSPSLSLLLYHHSPVPLLRDHHPDRGFHFRGRGVIVFVGTRDALTS